MYADGADVVYAPPAAPASACSRPPARPASPARCGRSASTATSTTWSTPTLQPYILTSMLKKVDVAVYDTIEALRRRHVRAAASQVFDLAVDGVGYSTSGGFVDDIVAAARRLQGSRSSTARSTCRPLPDRVVSSIRRALRVPARSAGRALAVRGAVAHAR